ncbi:MAG: HAMP domain-containing histidine kinase [Erysipelotrichaceae bacterium]|jgi:signal transduction histidine kinase|nr:HAMP domain-containing histidine kinase [Erysipelotrichaceae bacterium]
MTGLFIAAMILLSIVIALYLILRFEIKRIIRDLDEIIDHDTHKRLRTISLDHDISSLCSRFNYLLDENQKSVLDADRSFSAFKRAITNIAHDLRTPLTSAIGYVQMLNTKKLSTKQRNEYREIVETRLRNLSLQLNELFEYTQIVEDRKVFNMEKINLTNFVEETALSYYHDFKQKGFEVKIDLPSKPLYAIVDKLALGRILRNLIQNTLNHGSKNFIVGWDEDTQSLLFKNDAPDIDPKVIPHLFERFFSVANRSGKSGSGLGLAIVRELTRRLGGKVSAIGINGQLVISLSLKMAKGGKELGSKSN